MLLKNKSRQFMFCLKLLLVLGIAISLLNQFPIFTKEITVSIDGVKQRFNLKGLYINDLIEVLNNQYGIDNYKFVNGLASHQLLGDVDTVAVQTKKQIKIKSQDGERAWITFAATLQELMQEVHFAHIIDQPELLQKSVHSDLILEEKISEKNFEVEVIENPDLDEGVEHVIQEGQKTIVSELFSLLNQQSTKLGHLVLQNGRKKIVEKGTYGVWDKLAFCESRGQWNINTGNGYYGGLQFSAATWRTASRAVGLDIAYAHHATREQQIKAATWLLHHTRSGWGQWPSCARSLGLI